MERDWGVSQRRTEKVKEKLSSMIVCLFFFQTGRLLVAVILFFLRDCLSLLRRHRHSKTFSVLFLSVCLFPDKCFQDVRRQTSRLHVFLTLIPASLRILLNELLDDGVVLKAT